MRKFNWQGSLASIPSRNALHGLQAEGRTSLSHSQSASPNNSHARAVKVLALWALAVFSFDYASKTLASQLITPGAHSVIGTLLQLELVHNSGAAFSVGNSAGVLFAMVSLAAIAGILHFSRSLTSKRWATALGLLLGGVIGNLSDRCFRAPYWFRGEVIDWIKLPHWPVFNLADTSIVISAVAIALLLINNVKPRQLS